ncbi:MAG: energy transducer TonB [Acidobacteriota bacterium]
MVVPPEVKRPRNQKVDPHESPLALALRGDPGRGDRSRSAVALSMALHLGVAAAIGYASMRVVAPPPTRTIRVIVPTPPAPAPPPIKQGDPNGRRSAKPPEVKPDTPRKVVPPRPDPMTPPRIVAPIEQTQTADDVEAPYGDPNGDPDGREDGQIDGTGSDPDGVVGGDDHAPGDAPIVPWKLDKAKLRRKKSTVYPMVARRVGRQGTVVLDAIIGVDGRVEDIQIVTSVQILDDAAIAALRQWEFEPATVAGKAVRMRLTVSMTFNLER